MENIVLSMDYIPKQIHKHIKVKIFFTRIRTKTGSSFVSQNLRQRCLRGQRKRNACFYFIEPSQ
jgi:hypothetical protein